MKKISKPKKKLNDQFNRIFLSKAKIGNLKAFKEEKFFSKKPTTKTISTKSGAK